MTDAELLTKVKTGLGITGTYQDETLKTYIADVKSFLINSGVKQIIVDSSASVGCILRGVSDLWNYGSGNTSLSEYFKMSLCQLKKVKLLIITQAAGTTVTVTRRDGSVLTNEAHLIYRELLTISVSGGTVTVNGKEFVSGSTHEVSDSVIIISAAESEE